MKLILALSLIFASLPALADQYVRPHVRSDGTYVQGYHRSSPNNTTYDNYSTQGNVNPYTGESGHRSDGNGSPSWPSHNNYGYGSQGGYGYGNQYRDR